MKYNQNNNLKRIHKGWVVISLALLSVCVGSAIHNNNVHASGRNSVEPVNTQNTKQSLGQPSLVNNHLADKSESRITSQMISKRANSLKTGIIHRTLTQVKSTNYSNNIRKSYRSNFQNKSTRQLLGQNNNTLNGNVKYGQGTVTVPIYEKSQGQKNLTNNVTITVKEPVGSTTDLWTLFSGRNPVYTYSGHSLRSANGAVTVDKHGRVSLSPNAGVTYVGNSNGLDNLVVKVPINNTNRDFITLQLPDDVRVGSDILLTNDMIKSNPGNKYSIHGEVPIYYSDGPHDIVHKIKEYGSIINNSKPASSSAVQNQSRNSADINSSNARISHSTNNINSTVASNKQSSSNPASSQDTVLTSSTNEASVNSNSASISNSSLSIISQGAASVANNSPMFSSNVNNGHAAQTNVSSSSSSYINNKQSIPTSISSQSTLNPLSKGVSSDYNATSSRISNEPTSSQKSPLLVTNNSSTANSNVGSNNLNYNNHSRVTPSSMTSMNNSVHPLNQSKTDSTMNSATDNKSVSSQNLSNSAIESHSTNVSGIKSQSSVTLNHQNITNNVNSNSVNKSNELPQTGGSSYHRLTLDASALLMLSAMLLGLATDIDKHRLN